MKHFLLICLLALNFYVKSQMIFIGHSQLNGTSLKGVRVSLITNGKITQTLSPQRSADFNLRIDYGKNYKLYVQHPECVTMFVEINTDNVPEDKQYIKMVHEMDLPFYYKNDNDVDTIKFQQPVQKVYFDGKDKMISDTAYVSNFYRTLIKPQKNVQAIPQDLNNISLPCTITARVLMNNDTRLPVRYQEISLEDANGKVLKTTRTDRFGNFVVTTVIPSQIHKIRLSVPNGEIKNSSDIYLINDVQNFSAKTKLNITKAEWLLNNTDRYKLINNSHTGNIGGKLIHTSKGSKSFYANKTVYLSNKRNTILKKTKTNFLGAFSFDEIKPDQDYFIGVETKELEKGDKLDLLNKDDNYVNKLDTVAGGRTSMKFNSSNNAKYNAIAIDNSEMRMNVNAKIYGDNTGNPLGKIKILLLNDAYQVIDSTVTDDLGLFKFKYLPYLKRFYLSAENTNRQLDVFSDILMYSNDENLIKILTHVKGTKFMYKPLDAEIKRMQEIEMEDPWLQLGTNTNALNTNKVIAEPILFETNRSDLLPAAIETLNKISMVLKNNSKLTVEISAYTDCIGSDQDNLKLSNARANVVLNYLISTGIAKERLSARGYGESKPLNRCTNSVDCSELEHAVNRRVEFKIKQN